MIVTVKLFAGARQRAARSEVVLDLATGATVGDVRRALAREVPALAGFLNGVRLAVASEYAGDDQIVPEGAEVALIPPVSGG